MSKYQICCPGCNVVYNVGLSARGKTSKCRKCQTDFIIPDPPADLLQHLLAQQSAEESTNNASAVGASQSEQSPPVSTSAAVQPESPNASSQHSSPPNVLANQNATQPIPESTSKNQPLVDRPNREQMPPQTVAPQPIPQTIPVTIVPSQAPAQPTSASQAGTPQVVAKSSGPLVAGPQQEASPYEALVNQMMTGGQPAIVGNVQSNAGGTDYHSVNRQLNRTAGGAQVDDSSARLVFRGMSFLAFGLILFGIALLRLHFNGAAMAGPISAVVAIMIGMVGAFCILIGLRKRPGIAAVFGFVPIALFVGGGVWAFELNRNDFWHETSVAGLSSNAVSIPSRSSQRVQGTNSRVNGMPPSYGSSRNNATVFPNTGRNSSRNFSSNPSQIGKSQASTSPSPKKINESPATLPSSGSLFGSGSSNQATKNRLREQESNGNSQTKNPTNPSAPVPPKFVPEPYVDPFKEDDSDSKPFVNPFKSGGGARPNFPGGNRGPQSPRGGPPISNLDHLKPKIVDGVIKLPAGRGGGLRRAQVEMTSAAFRHFRGFPKDKITADYKSGPVGEAPGVSAEYLLNVQKKPMLGLDAGLGIHQKSLSYLVPVFSTSESSVEVAKPGYFVGALNLNVTGGVIHGIQVVYMRKKSKTRLDTSDSYLGNWVHDKPDGPSSMAKLECGGKLIYGIVVDRSRGLTDGIASLSLIHEK